MNVALSVASFLIVLAAGLMLDGDRHARGTHASPTDPLTSASPVSPSDTVASPDSPVQATDASDALLARAHGCAAAGDWSCVIETTSSVIAVRGDTPDTQALLEQAVVNGGWTPTGAAPPSLIDNASTVPSAPPLPTRTSQEVRHGHRIPVRSHVTVTRSGSTDYIAEIYHH